MYTVSFGRNAAGKSLRSAVAGNSLLVIKNQAKCSKNFHTVSKLANSAPSSTNIAAKKVKKTHPVRNFLLKVVFAGLVFYGGGAYLSLKSEMVNDYFTEYVPYADEVVNFVDANRRYLSSSELDDLKQKISDLKDKTLSIPQQGAIVETLGDAYNSIKSTISSSILSTSSTAPATASSSSKVVVQKTPVRFSLPEISFKSDNPEINSAVEKFNSLITAINNNDIKVSQQLVNKILDSIKTIESQLDQFKNNNAEVINKLTSKLTSENEIALKQQLNENLKELFTKFNTEVSQIKNHFEKVAAHDIEITKQRLDIEYDNKLKSLLMDQLKSFQEHVTEKIENERDGKLKNLQRLSDKIDKIQEVEIQLFENFEKLNKFNDLQTHLNILKNLVFNFETYQNNFDELNGKQILSEIGSLSNLTKDDDLTNLVVSSFPTKGIQSSGLLSNAQLKARWNLLVPELRSVSLLPPNAGILGHMSAKFFSFFLISKNGNVVDGADIESVIAKVNYNLDHNELANAIEIVSSLKGWTRKLSNDWLIEARKKLEVEFLVDLMDSEIKYSY